MLVHLMKRTLASTEILIKFYEVQSYSSWEKTVFITTFSQNLVRPSLTRSGEALLGCYIYNLNSASPTDGNDYWSLALYCLGWTKIQANNSILVTFFEGNLIVIFNFKRRDR